MDQKREANNYYLSDKAHVDDLVKRAEQEAKKIIEEFKLYYDCDLSIEITVDKYYMGYGIGAVMKVGGDEVRKYDDCGVCFLDLHIMIMQRMLDLRK